ncbi:unnamed protein product [Closterium sp. NIES-53]
MGPYGALNGAINGALRGLTGPNWALRGLRRPSSPSPRVPLPPPLASSLPVVADPASDRFRAQHSTSASVCPPSVGGECALGTDFLEDRQEDLECLAAAAPHLVSMLLAPEGDPDAPDIPTPHSYAEAIAGEYSSQWQTAMDAEMASWKSTGTYVDEVPPLGANIVSGMWIFRVKRPPSSPPVFKARYAARGFSQRERVDFFQTFSPTPKMTTLWVLLHVAAQRDYELHSLDFSTAFLQGSLHEEIWLRRPPGFIGSFPPGTQWSLRRPVYGLRQAPHEWHDILRTTLAALGFAPSTADPSLFLRTDTLLPPFYVLVYVDDLVFATADTEALTLVKSEPQKRHTCTDLGELRSYLGLKITRDRARLTIALTQSYMVQQVPQRFGFMWSSAQATPLATGHSLSAPPSDESVEPSGPYPELVGCLMYLMTCTRPDLAYPLGFLARYVAPGRHQKVHMDAAKRVLRYLCSTSGMGLVLGGRGDVVLTGHSDASWVDDQATQRSSSCEAEIYATAMAAQELRWLTYLLTGLGERPSSPPVLYVDNKAAIALCQEHRLEHRTKHIALRYFLARELQQRGQLRLTYVATRANTADIFTKALPPDAISHERRFTAFATSSGSTSTSEAEQKQQQEATSDAKKPAFEDVPEVIDEDVGEVEKILGSRVAEDGVTQYLIEWKDDHPDSWEPRENVAADLVAAFEEPWWTAVRRGDDAKIQELLAEGRDVNAVDGNGRSGLLFAAGLGNEKLVRKLLEEGADVAWQDKEGYSALHIASGYVHSTIVRALLDHGADPEQEDKQQRSPLILAEQLLKATPANNPGAFARRLALDNVVKMLDEAVFEESEVDQILDKRIAEDGTIEYLVKWQDDSEDSWEPVENIGEDLVKDFEEGLEYGVAEKILEKRVVGASQGGGEGVVEYLVKWQDSDENTWEPEGNVAADVIAEFEGVSVEEVEARLGKEGEK